MPTWCRLMCHGLVNLMREVSGSSIHVHARTQKPLYSWSYYKVISVAWKVRCFKQKSHSTQVFPEKLNQNSATLFLPKLLLFNRSGAFLWQNIKKNVAHAHSYPMNTNRTCSWQVQLDFLPCIRWLLCCAILICNQTPHNHKCKLSCNIFIL